MCPHDEPIQPTDLSHVEQLCEQVLTEPMPKSRWIGAGVGFLRGKSLTEGLFANRELSTSVRQLHLKNAFDLGLVFCSSMFQFVNQESLFDLPVFTDLVDVDSEKWRQMACSGRVHQKFIYGIEARRVLKLEQCVAKRSKSVFLVSDSEAEVFRSRV